MGAGHDHHHGGETRVSRMLIAAAILTAFFAAELGFKYWSGEVESGSPLYLPTPLVEHLTSLTFEDTPHTLQDHLMEEFSAAVEFTRI